MRNLKYLVMEMGHDYMEENEPPIYLDSFETEDEAEEYLIKKCEEGKGSMRYRVLFIVRGIEK